MSSLTFAPEIFTFKQSAGVPARTASGAPGQAPGAAQIEAMIDATADPAGGLWTMQYARTLAETHGPVGVVHIQPASLHAELVLPGGFRASQSPVNWPGYTLSRSPRQLAGALLRFARDREAPVQHWLLRLALPRHRTSVRVLAACARWSLICQSHSASLASGYSLMRELLRQRDAARPLQSWSMLAVGCDHVRARDAHQRLSRLLSPDASRTLAFVGNVRQITPTPSRFIGRCDIAERDWPAWTRWLTRLCGRLEHNETTGAGTGGGAGAGGGAGGEGQF